jgi:hypothetical protein
MNLGPRAPAGRAVPFAVLPDPEERTAMDGSSFDWIARVLAEGRSRRAVVRALAGSLAGGALGRRGGRAALAANRGNSAAAHFCAAIFGADTPAAGRCTSQATQGTGPYVACGGDPARFCGGACVDLQTDDLNCGACGEPCLGGSSCAGGQCVCPAGQHVDETGACTCAGTACATSADCCGLVDGVYPYGAFMCTAAQCDPCVPYFGSLEKDDPDPLPCCDGGEYADPGGFLPYICMATCQSDDDCLGAHICLGTGYCGCPADRPVLTATGACEAV